jgi:hypothetical protein
MALPSTGTEAMEQVCIPSPSDCTQIVLNMTLMCQTSLGAFACHWNFEEAISWIPAV